MQEYTHESGASISGIRFKIQYAQLYIYYSVYY
jgi:hypothetical protein